MVIFRWPSSSVWSLLLNSLEFCSIIDRCLTQQSDVFRLIPDNGARTFVQFGDYYVFAFLQLLDCFTRVFSGLGKYFPSKFKFLHSNIMKTHINFNIKIQTVLGKVLGTLAM